MSAQKETKRAETLRFDPEALTLANLCDGEALAAFQDGLGKVLDNIADPQTSSKPVRTITLTIAIAADEERATVDLSFVCKVKLAPRRPVVRRARLLADSGGRYARQLTLPMEEALR